MTPKPHSELNALINDAYATRSARSITALVQKARSLEEQLEAARSALRTLVVTIEGAGLMEFDGGYAAFEDALHAADRVLGSNPAKRPE